MVSPKYYSDTPTEVKRRILACMQQWNFSLMDQSKVREAYQMLVRQGVEFPDDVEMPVLELPNGDGYLDISAKSMVKRHSPLEEDAKKAKLLEKLLKSKDPNDLMKANKLIKKMVEIDAKKGQKAAETSKELDIVRTNAKLLTDMLQAHNPATDLAKNEIIQDLYKSCVAMRPKMFKMASNLDEEDPALGDVLTANDELTRVLDLYEETKVKGPGGAGGAVGGAGGLMDVPAAAAAPPPASNGLLDLFGSPAPASAPAPTGPPLAAQFGGIDLGGPSAAAPAASTSSSGLVDLFSAPSPVAAAPPPSAGGSLMDLLGGPSPAAAPAAGGSVMDMFGTLGSPASAPAASTPPPALESVMVPIESIQPASTAPVTVYSKNNLQLSFVFAQNPPHPTIAVVVISAMNLGTVPISGLTFQAAVPKALQVKLQPASSTTVPASNPMMGSQSVTQVMLIANPTKVPIKIRFKLDFVVGTQPMTDMGECSQFPPMN